MPTFFVFDERDHHDLDQIAARLIEQPLLPRDKFASLEAEYRRSDRYWSVFYPHIGFFKSQYDACENRILLGNQLPSVTPHDTPELVVTASGQAKRTALVEYRTQGRGGVGVHTSSVGDLIAAFVADVGDEMILRSKRGKVARLHVADVPQQGRATAGSYLIRLDAGDQLISALAVPGNRR